MKRKYMTFIFGLFLLIVVIFGFSLKKLLTERQIEYGELCTSTYMKETYHVNIETYYSEGTCIFIKNYQGIENVLFSPGNLSEELARVTLEFSTTDIFFDSPPHTSSDEVFIANTDYHGDIKISESTTMEGTASVFVYLKNEDRNQSVRIVFWTNLPLQENGTLSSENYEKILKVMHTIFPTE